MEVLTLWTIVFHQLEDGQLTRARPSTAGNVGNIANAPVKSIADATAAYPSSGATYSVHPCAAGATNSTDQVLNSTVGNMAIERRVANTSHD